MTFIPLRLLISGFLLQCLPLSGAIDSRSARRRGGIQIDASCDPFRSKVDEAITAALSITRAGFKEAQAGDHPVFELFFLPNDIQVVRETMRNAKQVLQNHSIPLVIKCNEDETCLNPKSAAYTKLLPDFASADYINLCRHTLDGTKMIGVQNDYCGDMIEDTISSVLLHEIFHVPSVGPASIKKAGVEVYAVRDCMILATGRVLTSNGTVFEPTSNPESYVHMAVASMFAMYVASPEKCPLHDRQELRRLQSTNITALGTTTGSSDNINNFTKSTDDEGTLFQSDDLNMPVVTDPRLDYSRFMPRLNLTTTQKYVLSADGQITP